MIVMNKAMLVGGWPRASHRPAKTIQMTLPMAARQPRAGRPGLLEGLGRVSSGSTVIIWSTPVWDIRSRACAERPRSRRAEPNVRSRRSSWMAATEVAANSIRHGGGQGVFRTWREDHRLVCEFRDIGYISDPLAGRSRPTSSQRGGRGLWLVHQL